MQDDFKITNPEDIPPGKSFTINQEDLRKIQEQNEALMEIRGRVISSSLNIEHKLDDILSVVFMGKSLESINLFKELLLEKEFFTFMNKWRLFKEICNRKIINFKDDSIQEETMKIIHNVMKTRDQFAHCEILFSGTIPTLRFVENGKKKFIILNDKYFDGQNIIFTQAYDILNDIFGYLYKS